MARRTNSPGPDLRKRAYNQHKGNAKLRGIPFLLTFDEWWSIWSGSGHWEQRGAHRGEYVMARHGDIGPYAVGNVRICLARENFDEADHRNFGERNGAYGRDFWAEATPEERAARSAAVSQKLRGRPKSPEWRAAMSEQQRGRPKSAEFRARITGRRRVFREGRGTWAYPGDPDYPQET
jgi:hypothetical protein